MQLFMIYIGGKHAGSLIELHDIRFVVANTIEETYEQLSKSWWGIPSSLHLDAWGAVQQVDGYDIILQNSPSQQEEQLYFVNLGGYDAAEFTELHKNICVVAKNEKEASQKAKEKIVHWTSPHKDYVHSVEDVFNVQTILSDPKVNIHLQPSKEKLPFEFTCRYVPIKL
ncbi:MAG: DUF1543 domain-containing protein [Proteobacteria bacterium]|nr:DUF1543 domain-containing protein [Pseudomonadota bacterium]